MSKFKFCVSEDKFSIIVHIFLKFGNVKHKKEVQRLNNS